MLSAGGTARSAFLFTGSPRFARDDNGDEVDNYALSNHPAPLGHPSNGGELGTYRRGLKFPSAEGCRLCRRGGYCTPVVQSMPPARGGGHCGMVHGE